MFMYFREKYTKYDLLSSIYYASYFFVFCVVL